MTMNKSYNIGGFLNFETPPQDLLDLITEIFDKLTKFDNKYTVPKLNMFVNCDEHGSLVTVRSEHGYYDVLSIRVTKYAARAIVNTGEHWITVEDDSALFLSRWRKNMEKISKKNLIEAGNSSMDEGMAAIREFLTSFLKKIDNEPLKQNK